MTDVELAERAAAGNAEAFESLYRKYDPLVRNVAHRVTRSAQIAEEAAAEVWFWLLIGRWRLEPTTTPADGTLFGFLAVISRHAAMKAQYRPSFLARQTTDDGDDRRLARLHSRYADPETALLRRELRERLHAAIDGLPRQYRRVAIARYFGELSGPDIAALVGVTPGTIPTYLQNVREKIRQSLAGYCHVPPAGKGRARGGHRRYAREEKRT